MYMTTLPSPIGNLTLASDGRAITGLWIEGQKYFAAGISESMEEAVDLPIFQEAARWLQAYFSKSALPAVPRLSPQGTPFRKAVWRLLMEIPYGTTTTYGALAKQLNEMGLSGSARAVGGAVGHNPISIFVPCHRVIGADGRLTGYAGGIHAKEWLLRLECSGEA